MSGRNRVKLGRGLASLLGESTSSNRQDGDNLVALDRIDPGRFQPRGSIDADSLSELTTSIKHQGVLQPILVRPKAADFDRYEIIAGERRWRAAQNAGLEQIPCFIRIMSDQEAMAAALVENLQRQDLNPIEEAEGFRRLIQEFGLTQEELGLVLGKSRSHVANQLRLLQLPPSVLAMVKDLSLTAGHARAVLSSAHPEAAAAAIVSQSLTVRQAEELCSRGSGHVQDTAATRRVHSTDPNIAAAETDLAERLGLKVNISFNGRSGSLRLHYRSVEQLDHILMLLGRP